MEANWMQIIELAMDGGSVEVSAADFRYDYLVDVAMRKKKTATLTIRDAHLYEVGQRREIAQRAKGPVAFIFPRLTSDQDQ